MELQTRITSLITILFFIIFSFLFGGEYFDFHKQKRLEQVQNSEITKQVNDFQLTDIRLLESTQLISTPNENLLTYIIDQIDNAQEKIYIEIYIFTQTDIQQALSRAKKRNIDIQIIMEKNPYLAGNINSKTASFLKGNNIPYSWSNSQNYAYNHSKFLIIDEQIILSTGNLSDSTFMNNRDFFIISYDTEIKNGLEQIFTADLGNKKQNVYKNNLLLSPFYSRDKFKKLFDSADSSIIMYFQYFKDNALINTLIEKQKAGINVSAIIDKSAKDSNSEELQRMIESGINIKYLKHTKMHAKAILIDNTYLFIGSVNFSNYSLDLNREVGILINNPDIITTFRKRYFSEKTSVY